MPHKKPHNSSNSNKKKKGNRSNNNNNKSNNNNSTTKNANDPAVGRQQREREREQPEKLRAVQGGPKMEEHVIIQQPVLDGYLEDKQAKQCFEKIVRDFYLIPFRSYKGFEDYRKAYNKLSNRVIEAVNQYPILVTTVSTHWENLSLLYIMAMKTKYPEVQPAIKLLIQQNPGTLLWEFALTEGAFYEDEMATSPIKAIASNRTHVTLMPWIAQNFPWIFDKHDEKNHLNPVTRIPPHIQMIEKAKDPWVGVKHSIIQQFYEIYPKGLRQSCLFSGSGLPIHVYLYDENRG